MARPVISTYQNRTLPWLFSVGVHTFLEAWTCWQKKSKDWSVPKAIHMHNRIFTGILYWKWGLEQDTSTKFWTFWASSIDTYIKFLGGYTWLIFKLGIAIPRTRLDKKSSATRCYKYYRLMKVNLSKLDGNGTSDAFLSRCNEQHDPCVIGISERTPKWELSEIQRSMFNIYQHIRYHIHK